MFQEINQKLMFICKFDAYSTYLPTRGNWEPAIGSLALASDSMKTRIKRLRHPKNILWFEEGCVQNVAKVRQATTEKK